MTCTEKLSKHLVCEVIEFYSSSFWPLNYVTSQKKSPLTSHFVLWKFCSKNILSVVLTSEKQDFAGVSSLIKAMMPSII